MAPPPPPPARKAFALDALVAPARAQAQAAAQAAELGDLFEYKLKEPITIAKNQSAMVPIVQSPIAAEKVSIWNELAGLPRPQRALWLTNSSGLTLDCGSFSVLEEETFAGEGIFDPIRPSEKRLVSYASDLALNVSSRIGSEQSRVFRVRVIKGLMTQESERRKRRRIPFATKILRHEPLLLSIRSAAAMFFEATLNRRRRPPRSTAFVCRLDRSKRQYS